MSQGATSQSNRRLIKPAHVHTESNKIDNAVGSFIYIIIMHTYDAIEDSASARTRTYTHVCMHPHIIHTLAYGIMYRRGPDWARAYPISYLIYARPLSKNNRAAEPQNADTQPTGLFKSTTDLNTSIRRQHLPISTRDRDPVCQRTASARWTDPKIDSPYGFFAYRPRDVVAPSCVYQRCQLYQMCMLLAINSPGSILIEKNHTLWSTSAVLLVGYGRL